MDILEYRLENLEKRFDELQSAFIQSQKNQIPITNKSDETSNRVDDLTPYKVTKIAYYGETEKTFYDVPKGDISVFFDGYDGVYSVQRIEDRLIVSFGALEHETQITISII